MVSITQNRNEYFDSYKVTQYLMNEFSSYFILHKCSCQNFNGLYSNKNSMMETFALYDFLTNIIKYSREVLLSFYTNDMVLQCSKIHSYNHVISQQRGRYNQLFLLSSCICLNDNTCPCEFAYLLMIHGTGLSLYPFFHNGVIQR